MDKLVDSFLSFPSSQNISDSELNKQIQNHLALLNRTPAATLAYQHAGGDVLTLLDPSVNSLAYLYILVARIDLGQKNTLEVGWRQIVTFLESFNPKQVRCAQDIFRRLVDAFFSLATESGKPIIAVRPIKKAILRFNPTKFSFLHPLFLRLCLEAKCYRDAAAIVDIDIVEFPISAGKVTENSRAREITYQDVLTYFLYAGMIYMGIKEWRRAADYLTYAIVAPGTACSQIQIDAYKKYILVGLLLDGKSLPIPRSTAVAASRAYKALSRPYESFASAFKAGNPELLRTEVAQLVDVFRQDNNTGLAIQCLEAFRRMQIIALRDTYVTLSTEEISKKDLEVTGRGGDIGGKEGTEAVILGMIEREEISASLSHSHPNPEQSQTTVHFHNHPVDESRNLAALQVELRRIMTLNKQMKTINKKYGMSREFIQYMVKMAKMSGNSGLAGMAEPDPMDFDYGFNWPEDEPEEAIMQDLDDDM
ncbi:hypothetical protein L873DRAFT_1815426 [Choiromyces venosus 120613-1]|uniref:COP9 signalosome complex subunit 3 N-terminal helical repeats domain-containing protein n=1 Tax=Choiromyces venosus 120613-1 TaxID=1336337 RepID=A0A3N4J8U9_9PEZI|nr:hypothetical protein L873DRAFT_1815426 [Choiromyces venosus 120613-1]